jgi:hypothetical protein
VKLADDPRLAAYQSRAGDFVKAYSYHDQMSGTPIRDEQGTRDRPYDLIVDFDERKTDGVLKALGLAPWLSRRPVLAVLVEMDLGTTHYIVTADAGLSAVAPRQSLLASIVRRGMPIVLPDAAALAKSGIDGAGLAKLPPSALTARAAELGGEVALVGRLKWDDSDLAWAAESRCSGRAGRTDGGSAASPSMKSSAAPSAMPRKSSPITAIRRSRSRRHNGQQVGVSPPADARRLGLRVLYVQRPAPIAWNLSSGAHSRDPLLIRATLALRQLAGRAMCQRLAESKPLVSPGALSSCQV